jgi:hypothetical protein
MTFQFLGYAKTYKLSKLELVSRKLSKDVIQHGCAIETLLKLAGRPDPL